jgi:L-alanine-DL-glutamate epimerase-like enolase superfamily enzyme
MKITRIELFSIYTPREYGYISSHQIVRLHGEDGHYGLGEISDHRLPERAPVEAELNRLLQGRDADDIAVINEELLEHDFQASIAAHVIAAGVDLALWDLQGRLQEKPVYTLLGGKYRERMKACYPIFGTTDPAQIEKNMERIQRVVDHGHDLVRFYISGDLEIDFGFLSATQERFGGAVRFKSFDFSQRFNDADEALKYYEGLRPLDPMIVEGPSNDLEVATEFVRRTDLPVSMHAGLIDHAYDIIDRRAADILNIATSTAGITYARHYASLAKAADVDLLIGTDQEASIGIAAQLHFAVTLPVLDYPGDPFGSLLYTTDVVREKMRYEGGYTLLPKGHGLGMELDEGLLEEQLRRGDPE